VDEIFKIMQSSSCSTDIFLLLFSQQFSLPKNNDKGMWNI